MYSNGINLIKNVYKKKLSLCLWTLNIFRTRQKFFSYFLGTENEPHYFLENFAVSNL